jgi:hypothetical protein
MIMHKIDLSHVRTFGSIWGRGGVASNSWGWLCERTNHPQWKEYSLRYRVIILDGYPTDISSHDPQIMNCGMVQMYDGPGFTVVTYHEIRSVNIINVLIEDDMLAMEFQLAAPWYI